MLPALGSGRRKAAKMGVRPLSGIGSAQGNTKIMGLLSAPDLLQTVRFFS